MTHRRTAIILFFASLLFHLAWVAVSPYATYPDAAYYDAAARAMANSGRFEVPFLWSWIETGFVVPAHLALPMPAFAHWGPLASLVAVPFILLAGALPFASAVPQMLAAAALAPLTYLLARHLGARQPLAAGAIAAVAGLYGPLLSQPDNYALYALLANSALLAAVSARAGRPRLWLLAGFLAGLAWLSRADGLVLAGAIGLVALTASGARAKTTSAAAIIAGFALPALPWMARQMAVFGSPFPSGSSGALWIRSYNQQFTADGPFTISSLFNDGPLPVLAVRLEAVGLLFGAYAAVLLGVVFLPGLIAGIRARRTDGRLLPFAVYAIAYAVWSVVFAAPHLSGGTLLHGLLALGPISWILAVDGGEGLFAALERRGHLRPGAPRRMRVLFLAIVLLLGTLVPFRSALPAWAAARDAGVAIAAGLPEGARSGPVAVSNPVQVVALWRAAAIPAVLLPLRASPEQALRVLRASEASALALDPRFQAELVRAWTGANRPSWLGMPIEMGYRESSGAEAILFILPLTAAPPAP